MCTYFGGSSITVCDHSTSKNERGLKIYMKNSLSRTPARIPTICTIISGVQLDAASILIYAPQANEALWQDKKRRHGSIRTVACRVLTAATASEKYHWAGAVGASTWRRDPIQDRFFPIVRM